MIFTVDPAVVLAQLESIEWLRTAQELNESGYSLLKSVLSSESSARFQSNILRRAVHTRYHFSRCQLGLLDTMLFNSEPLPLLPKGLLGPGTAFLSGFAIGAEKKLLSSLGSVIEKSPFRYMTTPGGFRMSVAMSNCGSLGWITDRTGYRYESADPETKRPWPEMPMAFRALAEAAALEGGFSNFVPDACLINRYEPGSKLSLHQDKDESDYSQPIVSVSLGLPVTFLFGGSVRSAKAIRVPLVHGDVVVWGGPARLHYHGVATLGDGNHPLLGRVRFNLTFRRAGRP